MFMTHENEALGDQSKRGRFLIVDGHAYAYRAFHAIRQLNSPEGRPTNAIYGFIRMLMKLVANLQPSHVAVVWDGGLAAERMQMLPEYKAQRPAMPSDLEIQLDEIGEYLKAVRITSLVRDGIEADDWIAALAEIAAAAGLQVIVASSDKDFMQLVSEQVGLINPNDKTETIWTREQVVAKTGVEPNQIIDWLSLIGDAVDNIAGVPGIGPKTATDLLRQFGSIDGIYTRVSEIKSERIRCGLIECEQIVRRNQLLIRLSTKIPADLSLVEFCVKPSDTAQLRELFTRWGFRVLLREMEDTQARQELLL
jgi:DNA polymerase I